MEIQKTSRKGKSLYLFKYLLIINFLQYLEAGAVPAELVSLASAFGMGHGQQGLLGGVVYIALSAGGPCAGYMLRYFDHRTVLGISLLLNCLFTLMWSTVPVHFTYSKSLFISLRFLMGLSQCTLCVFLPLWINEYAPSDKRTAWMSYLQMSVPFGIMTGYVLASIFIAYSDSSNECHTVLCWRFPFLCQTFLLLPLAVAMNFVPKEHLKLKVLHRVDSMTSDNVELNVELATSSHISSVAKGPCSGLSASQPPARPAAHRTSYSLSKLPTSVESKTEEGIVDEVCRTPPFSISERIEGEEDEQDERDVNEINNLFYSDHLFEVSDSHSRTCDLQCVTDRQQRSTLRRQCINASLYSGSATKDILRRSYEDISFLDVQDNWMDMFPGVIWGSRAKSSMKELKAQSGDSDNDENECPPTSTLSLNPSMQSLASDWEMITWTQEQEQKEQQQESDHQEGNSLSTKDKCTHLNPVVEGDGELSPCMMSSTGSYGAVSSDDIDEGISLTQPIVIERSPSSTILSSLACKYESFRDIFRKPTVKRTVLPDRDWSVAEGSNKTCGENSSRRSTGYQPSLLKSSFPTKKSSLLESQHGMEMDGSKKTAFEPMFQSEASKIQYCSDSDSASDEDWAGFTPRHSLAPPSRPARSSAGSKSLCGRVASLFGIEVYRYLLAAMAALYFTVTGVQFWGTSYMTVTLGAPLWLVHYLFIFCAATGPTAGVFVGGLCVDALGGYKGARQRVVALELCSIFGILACGFATPITFCKNIFVVSALLWMVLFCGGAVMPSCSGIIVSIVPRNHRHISSSIAMIVFNLFGYFLSLVLSGFLMQLFGDFHSSCDEACALTWGLRLILLWSYWSLLFLLLSLASSYRIVQGRLAAKRLAWQSNCEV